nr:ATP-binding protein [Bordetella trematum]
MLDNALKYSSGSVTLTARAQDGEIEIQVCDQGAGLDENALRLAVEPFWRGASRSRAAAWAWPSWQPSPGGSAGG